MMDESRALDVPPGWYPDGALGHERYWDGSSWTDETRDQPVSFEAPGSSGPVIAGFWKRSAAFILDGLMLGAVGSALGFGLFDVMAGLGAWGRLVGFAISLAYFGLMDSALGNGQTLGKRAMKVRVVDRDGTTLPVWKAMARFSILAAPTYLNNLALPATAMTPAVSFVIGIILFGVGAALVYLYLFNKVTRQSLHDLSVGSFVVTAGSQGPIMDRIWRGHLVVAAGVACFALLAVGASSLLAAKLPPGMTDAVLAINEGGRVHTASVFVGKAWGPDGVSDYVSISALVKKEPDDPEVLMTELAETVLSAYPGAGDVDRINVSLTYGFDLGIATGWRSVANGKAPDEWVGESYTQ